MRTLSNQQRTNALWALFAAVIVFGMALLTLVFDEGRMSDTVLLMSAVPMAGLLFLHAVWTLGMRRSLMFFGIAALTGYLFEFIGVKTGITFGGTYVYTMNGVMLFDVPLLIPLAWSLIIYVCYSVTTSFLIWNAREKPRRDHGGALLLPFLVLFDGFLVVALDLFMDPIQVMANRWYWVDGGAYHGIPLGNFLGWFLVGTISTGLFRLYEYAAPARERAVNATAYIIPVIGYGIVCFGMIAIAVSQEFRLLDVALTGFFTMFPVVVLNLLFFTIWATDKIGTDAILRRFRLPTESVTRVNSSLSGLTISFLLFGKFLRSIYGRTYTYITESFLRRK